MFVLPTFGLGVIGSPTVPPETFDTATLENGLNVVDLDNTITFTMQPSASISAGETITLVGLTGSQTSDNASLTVGGASAAIFGSSADWTQSSGTLVLTIAGGQSVPTGSDTVITFTLQNSATTQSGQTVSVSSSGFATTNATGTVMEAIANAFDGSISFPTIDIFDNESEFIGLTYAPNNTIVHAKDTDKLYVFEGLKWYKYNNDSTV